jgi:pyruvate formate lyase activating enzyme
MEAEKNAGKPLILEIHGNSLDDGPGIRSVVFFKGCPLSCGWCHNPEGKLCVVEIAFNSKECVGCNNCMRLCPENALSRKNRYFIDRTRCSLCFRCADACPSEALSRVGREMEVGEIMNTVMKDKPFYDISGGGVTLSGGEPTLYMDFLSFLMRSFKANGIHCILETCGQFAWERFTDLVYPYLDAIYFDLKIYDSDSHKFFCGISNTTILGNFIRLAERSREDGKELLPRIPLVPGITDTDANLSAIAAFLISRRVTRAKLLPYNPLWPDKNSKLGGVSANLGTTLMKWMPQERVKHCESIFHKYGINV